MPTAAIALDVDQTMLHPNSDSLRQLSDLAKARDVTLYVNTARPDAYCAFPTTETTAWVAADRHLCRPEHERDVPRRKADNMAIVARREGLEPACTVLVDDLPSNVSAVRAYGYGGVVVRNGIDAAAVDAVFRHLESECATVALGRPGPPW